MPLIDLSDIDPAHHEAVERLVRSMRRHGNRREDPVRSTLAYLGDRWSTLILHVLAMGSWRHADLRRVLGRLGSEEKISQRVLTAKLRTLERDGFVVREVSREVPPKVSYSLTAMGRDLHAQAQELIDWVLVSAPAIRAARVRFDSAD